MPVGVLKLNIITIIHISKALKMTIAHSYDRLQPVNVTVNVMHEKEDIYPDDYP